MASSIEQCTSRYKMFIFLAQLKLKLIQCFKVIKNFQYSKRRKAEKKSVSHHKRLEKEQQNKPPEKQKVGRK